MRWAARCLYNQRHAIAAGAERLRALFEAVAWGNDLFLPQWAHLYALALEFAPDLIIELGRGRGNSTCVFTEAANQLAGCRVVSLCLTRDWHELTWPSVRRVVPDDWPAPLDARVEDIVAVDFDELCRGAARVLVFWDAHGIGVADCVLARLLPAIADRPHLVAMHDISDARYCGVTGDYGGLPFWRGQEGGWSETNARLRLGWMETVVEQAIPAVDFLSRNGLELDSADNDVHLDIVSHPDRLRALQADCPSDMFSPVNHWVYFTLNAASGAHYFPSYPTAHPKSAGEAQSEHEGSAPPQEQATNEELLALAQYDRLGRALSRDLMRSRLFGRATPLTWLRVLAKVILRRY